MKRYIDESNIKEKNQLKQFLMYKLDRIVNGGIHVENLSKNDYPNYNLECFDIMTSYWAILKEEIRENCSDILENNNVPKNKINMYRNEKNNNTYIWLKFLLEKNNFNIINKRISKESKEFLNYCYTIGNIINIPKNFNSGRNINNKTDYWDLTLIAIYNYYYNENNVDININEKIKNKYISLFKKKEVNDWLKSYSNFKDFIDNNYLNPYVDNNYKPKILCNHDFINPLPKNDQIIILYKNLIKCIKKRNDLIEKASK